MHFAAPTSQKPLANRMQVLHPTVERRFGVWPHESVELNSVGIKGLRNCWSALQLQQPKVSGVDVRPIMLIASLSAVKILGWSLGTVYKRFNGAIES